MHEVRVYQNHHEGTRWWAEDDLGFTGGSEYLDDLVASIHEWADAECVLDALQIRLVAAGSQSPVSVGDQAEQAQSDNRRCTDPSAD